MLALMNIIFVLCFSVLGASTLVMGSGFGDKFIGMVFVCIAVGLMYFRRFLTSNTNPKPGS